MSKISIIIAIYNAENLITRCLTSLINQSYKNLEIICVNDGSTDNSLKVLENFAQKDNRIIVINQENKGSGGARNTALEYMTGEYFCFTDVDDYRSLDCIEKMYEGIKKYNTDASCCDAIFIDENENFLKLFNRNYPYNEVISTETILKTGRTLYQCQYLFKSDKVKHIRAIEGICYEDSAYMAEVLMNINNFVLVKDAKYYYKINSISSSGGNTNDVLKMYILLEHYTKTVEKYKNNPKYNLLKSNENNNLNFFMGKIFKRVPIDTSFIKIFSTIIKCLKYLPMKLKLYYLTKLFLLFLYQQKNIQDYKFHKILGFIKFKHRRKNK